MNLTPLRGTTARLLVLAIVTSLLVTVAPLPAHAATRAFWFHNMTTRNVRLLSTESQSDPDGSPIRTNLELPPSGAIVPPGAELRFELDSGRNQVAVELRVLNDSGADVGRMWLVFRNTAGNVRYSHGGFEPGAGTEGMRAVLVDQDNYLYEAPGDIDASAIDVELQATFVTNMCERSEAKCSYTLTARPQEGFSRQREITAPIKNRTCSTIHETDTFKDARTLENNWNLEITAKTGVKDVWEVGIKASYGGKFTSSFEFSKSDSYEILRGFSSRVVSEVRVRTFIGDYTIITTNDPITKWTIKNVHVDMPAPDLSETPSLDFVAVPLSDQERLQIETNCPHS